MFHRIKGLALEKDYLTVKKKNNGNVLRIQQKSILAGFDFWNCKEQDKLTGRKPGVMDGWLWRMEGRK
jgi:hypothetical protein